MRSNPADNSAPAAEQVTSSSNDSSSSTSSSHAEAREDFVVRCTKILTTTGEHHQQQEEEDIVEQQQQQQQEEDIGSGQIQPYPMQETYTVGYSCATAILQHSYLEMVCGRRSNAIDDVFDDEQQHCESNPPSPSRRRIPDDPTVQDSIECVFASQLEEGLALWAEEDDDEDDANKEYRDDLQTTTSIPSYEEEPINAPSESELPSPAPLMQSRQKSRTPLPAAAKAMIPNKRRSHPSSNPFHNNKLIKKNSSSSSPLRRRKKYQTAKMVHVGTFDPRTNRILEVAETDHNLMEEDPAVRVATCSIQSPPRHSSKCFCQSNSLPVVPAEFWPQAPLLLRPTPGQGITVLGVRKSGQSEHFWKPENGGWWLTPLYELDGKETPSLPPNVPSMCAQCCLLPINNGNEPVGEALVTDFETPLFEGTLLVRLRHVAGGATTSAPEHLEYDDSKGYFAGLNRRYQVVIRGKFKKEIPVTGMVSGCVMDRPFGKLPPKWIMKGAVKVLSFFAPQLEVQMDCPRPKTMAPLGSTPQALVVQEIGPQDELPLLDSAVEEPRQAKDSLVREVFQGNSSLQRARGRKKAFDKLYAAKSKTPLTQVSSGGKETYYTFEFLQHLVNFQDFSVELGSMLGSLPIAPIFAGHPLPIMAMIKEGEQKIWSFDVWHESLVEGAKKYDEEKQADSKQWS